MQELVDENNLDIKRIHMPLTPIHGLKGHSDDPFWSQTGSYTLPTYKHHILRAGSAKRTPSSLVSRTYLTPLPQFERPSPISKTPLQSEPEPSPDPDTEPTMAPKTQSKEGKRKRNKDKQREQPPKLPGQDVDVFKAMGGQRMLIEKENEISTGKTRARALNDVIRMLEEEKEDWVNHLESQGVTEQEWKTYKCEGERDAKLVKKIEKVTKNYTPDLYAIIRFCNEQRENKGIIPRERTVIEMDIWEDTTKRINGQYAKDWWTIVQIEQAHRANIFYNDVYVGDIVKFPMIINATKNRKGEWSEWGCKPRTDDTETTVPSPRGFTQIPNDLYGDKQREAKVRTYWDYKRLRRQVYGLMRLEYKDEVMKHLRAEDLRVPYSSMRIWKTGWGQETDMKKAYAVLEALRCHGLGTMPDHVMREVVKYKAEFLLYPRVTLIESEGKMKAMDVRGNEHDIVLPKSNPRHTRGSVYNNNIDQGLRENEDELEELEDCKKKHAKKDPDVTIKQKGKNQEDEENDQREEPGQEHESDHESSTDPESNHKCEEDKDGESWAWLDSEDEGKPEKGLYKLNKAGLLDRCMTLAHKCHINRAKRLEGRHMYENLDSDYATELNKEKKRHEEMEEEKDKQIQLLNEKIEQLQHLDEKTGSQEHENGDSQNTPNDADEPTSEPAHSGQQAQHPEGVSLEKNALESNDAEAAQAIRVRELLEIFRKDDQGMCKECITLRQEHIQLKKVYGKKILKERTELEEKHGKEKAKIATMMLEDQDEYARKIREAKQSIEVWKKEVDTLEKKVEDTRAEYEKKILELEASRDQEALTPDEPVPDPEGDNDADRRLEDMMRSEREEHDKKITSMTEIVDIQKDEIDSLTKELEGKSAELAQAILELEIIKSQEPLTPDRLAPVLESNDKVTKDLERIQARCQDLEAENKDLKEARERRMSNASTPAPKADELLRWKKGYTKVKNDLHDKQKEVDNLKTEIYDMSKKKTELENKLKRVRDENDENPRGNKRPRLSDEPEIGEGDDLILLADLDAADL